MASVRRSKAKSRRPNAKPVKITRHFLDALTGAKEDAYYRVLDALGLTRRERISPTKAAKRSGTKLKTMRKYAPSAFEERSGRQYVKPSDRLPRRMRMLTPSGEKIVHTTSSRTATLIAEYNNALREYVLTGDTAEIRRIGKKTVRSGGQTYTFARRGFALRLRRITVADRRAGRDPAKSRDRNARGARRIVDVA